MIIIPEQRVILAFPAKSGTRTMEAVADREGWWNITRHRMTMPKPHEPLRLRTGPAGAVTAPDDITDYQRLFVVRNTWARLYSLYKELHYRGRHAGASHVRYLDFVDFIPWLAGQRAAYDTAGNSYYHLGLARMCFAQWEMAEIYQPTNYLRLAHLDVDLAKYVERKVVRGPLPHNNATAAEPPKWTAEMIAIARRTWVDGDTAKLGEWATENTDTP